MVDLKETQIPTPGIVAEAANSIKESGEFKRGLTGNEVSSLVKGVVGEIVTGNPQVQGNIPFMNVEIANGAAEIKGSVRVEKPLGATVGVDMELKNNPDGSNSIILGNIKISPKADNFVGGAVLKGLNLENKAKQALSNPTQALKTYLGQEMKKQGVDLKDVAMKFTSDDKFTILLRGSSR